MHHLRKVEFYHTLSSRAGSSSIPRCHRLDPAHSAVACVWIGFLQFTNWRGNLIHKTPRFTQGVQAEAFTTAFECDRRVNPKDAGNRHRVAAVEIDQRERVLSGSVAPRVVSSYSIRSFIRLKVCYQRRGTADQGEDLGRVNEFRGSLPAQIPDFGLMWLVLSALQPALKSCPSDDDVVPSPRYSANGCRNWALTNAGRRPV